MTEKDIEEAEREMDQYVSLEQTKSIWEPEEARINRWVLRTDEPTVDAKALLKRVGLPETTQYAEVDASTWTNFKTVGAAMEAVFNDDSWKSDALSDREAERLFWTPPFVLISNFSKLAAVAAHPFVACFFSLLLPQYD